MKWSLRLARIAGIELKIHFTFLFLLVWIGFSDYAQGGRLAALQGIAFIVLLFSCVVLHEFGHALTARRFGVRTSDITLLPIGGVARLDRIPENPRQEFLIAAAGPMVNVLIAALLILILKGQPRPPDVVDLGTSAIGGLIGRLAAANIFLVIFNLIPAFPMDGGRILRSLLAMKLSYVTATHISARIGQALAIVFGLIGLFLFYNPFLLLIAVFVFLGATQEAAMVEVKESSKGVPVSAAMVTEFKALPLQAQIEEAAQAMLRTSQHEFPVVDEAGHPAGLLLREDIVRALRETGNHTPVVQAMRGFLEAIRPQDDLNEAFNKMLQSGSPALPVVDVSGRLVGLLTTENVSEMMMIKSARDTEQRAQWRPSHA